MSSEKEYKLHKLHFCTSKGLARDLLCRGEMFLPLFQMSKIMSENQSLTETLSFLLGIMKENMGVLRGIISLYNSYSGKIFIHQSMGLTAEEENRGVYDLGEGITGKVVETGQAIVVPSIVDEPAFLNKTGTMSKAEDARIAFVCLPIKLGNKVLGTISTERVCDNPELLKYDVEILGVVATMIAQAVELYLLENEEKTLLLLENERLRNALKSRFRPENIIGNSKPMMEVYALIEKIAKTKSTVLLLGESGVGKELVANAIHYNSPDANMPFVKFNCAALPESIIESELFGHEKGAFTGADKFRKGRFEEADGGTIFLDEIGELSLPMQAKLLRILQEKTFERVGGNTPIKVNIRVVAATNRNLLAMASEGTFREDLYYRVNVFPINIPPLRERNNDILTIAEYFVDKFSAEFEKKINCIPVPVQQLLLNYNWPGNVRELENIIERAVILTDDECIHVHHLPLSLQTGFQTGSPTRKSLLTRLEAVEYEMIIDSLSVHKGNISVAADELGLTRRMLGLRMEKFGIDYKEYRHPEQL